MLRQVRAESRVLQLGPYFKHTRLNIDYFLWGGEKNKQLNAGRSTGCGAVGTARGGCGHGYAAGVAASGRAGVLCTPGVCFKHGFGGHAVERRAQARREALPRSRNPKGMFAKLAASRPRARGVSHSRAGDRAVQQFARCSRSHRTLMELRGNRAGRGKRARLRGFSGSEKIFTDGA